MLQICETFVSLSGESSWQGLVTTFIRFAGCDVDCEWCDTEYARTGESTPVELEQVVSICRANGAGRVILTGGEPMLQEELPQLCRALLEEGFAVQVETSGTRLMDRLDQRVKKVVDIKPPGAKAKKKFHWGNLDLLQQHDEIKFVLTGREDYDWSLSIIAKVKLDRMCGIIFSPVAGRLDPAELAGWMVEDRPPARLQLQLHKQIWPDEPRGR
ncbi:MAG: radical SAM protein [Candidatus Glassbacteria bacterium]|nr:radical SAM protein [Candidatus Glassbacteria bacterium]